MTEHASPPADAGDGWIKPTTHFWQVLRSAAEVGEPQPPFRYAYPARLPDGRYLDLPLRRIAGSADRAVASLIANQASFTVVAALAAHMTDLARPLAPQVIVGLPTLGLAFAPLVAQGLGMDNFVPLGYSRKFWYDEALSVPVRSLTTPGAGKTLYLDPNMLPRLAGRRVLVVDDAISSGQTIVSSLDLLARAGAEVAGIVVAMLQGDAWRAHLAAAGPDWPARVHGVFVSPRFVLAPGGWVPETAA
jgi:adenine/guanine phosphoribosyltransferase-like PRPP-binding protein